MRYVTKGCGAKLADYIHYLYARIEEAAENQCDESWAYGEHCETAIDAVDLAKDSDKREVREFYDTAAMRVFGNTTNWDYF